MDGEKGTEVNSKTAVNSKQIKPKEATSKSVTERLKSKTENLKSQPWKSFLVQREHTRTDQKLTEKNL